MNLEGIDWIDEPALDVHVLRSFGPTADLRTLLALTFSDPDATVRADQLTAAQQAILVGGGVTFAPQYPFTPAQHFILVDPQRGTIVTTVPNNTSPRIYNFNVRAVVQQIQPDPQKNDLSPLHAYIRFHIHDAFVRNSLRLNPARLTVGLGTSSSGFDVVGEFTDGVVADFVQRAASALGLTLNIRFESPPRRSARPHGITGRRKKRAA